MNLHHGRLTWSPLPEATCSSRSSSPWLPNTSTWSLVSGPPLHVQETKSCLKARCRGVCCSLQQVQQPVVDQNGHVVARLCAAAEPFQLDAWDHLVSVLCFNAAAPAVPQGLHDYEAMPQAAPGSRCRPCLGSGSACCLQALWIRGPQRWNEQGAAHSRAEPLAGLQVQRQEGRAPTTPRDVGGVRDAPGVLVHGHGAVLQLTRLDGDAAGVEAPRLPALAAVHAQGDERHRAVAVALAHPRVLCAMTHG